MMKLSQVVILTVVAFALVFAGCDSTGAGGGGGNDDDSGAGGVTLEDGDLFRAVQIGIDDNSTWFHVIDSEVNGDVFDATLTRISDQGPPEGTSFAMDWNVDSSNKLTFSNLAAGMSAVGRLNLTGDTYVSRDGDLTDDEGSLGVGVKATTGASNATLSGTYFVGMVHSDTSASPGYFSGYARMDFDGAGTVTVTAMGNDQSFTDYLDDPSSYSYSVASSGLISITNHIFPRDLIGAVRSDGELFVLAETRGTPDSPDNSYKTIFVGVKQSEAATDALLEGTWDVCSSCSDLTPEPNIGWWEGADEMVIDADGAESMGLSAEGEFVVPLADEMSATGAVTPSGDTMVIVYPEVHPEDNDYCMSIGIRMP